MFLENNDVGSRHVLLHLSAAKLFNQVNANIFHLLSAEQLLLGHGRVGFREADWEVVSEAEFQALEDRSLELLKDLRYWNLRREQGSDQVAPGDQLTYIVQLIGVALIVQLL